MRHLSEYLTESEKGYEYRIKVLGEFPKEVFDLIKKSLEMFDIESCSDVKETPIQDEILDFPGIKNDKVNIFDIVVNYPANYQQIVEMMRIYGITPNRVVVKTKSFDESMQKDFDNREEGPLLTSEYPEDTKEQKEANDDYASSFQDAAKKFANGGSPEFEIAGDKTPKAKFNTDEDGGKKSPLSDVKVSVKDLLK